MAGNLIGRLNGCDVYFGGKYQIRGTVSELGVNGSYRVRLYERKTGNLLREAFSAKDGSYKFDYITQSPNNISQNYFIVAYDHGDNPLNASIADFVTPELMS